MKNWNSTHLDKIINITLNPSTGLVTSSFFYCPGTNYKKEKNAGACSFFNIFTIFYII
jgi:hypothetical protein